MPNRLTHVSASGTLRILKSTKHCSAELGCLASIRTAQPAAQPQKYHQPVLKVSFRLATLDFHLNGSGSRKTFWYKARSRACQYLNCSQQLTYIQLRKNGHKHEKCAPPKQVWQLPYLPNTDYHINTECPHTQTEETREQTLLKDETNEGWRHSEDPKSWAEGKAAVIMTNHNVRNLT